ncbi:hypothetical protein BU15DRAFT_79179 [Melanogaster broomeanus]|nr:hypothetical protein BU15DRAFT_79179 [Melanogaster broomeanus]
MLTHCFFPADSESEDESSDQLEEIDFADLGKIRAEVDAVAAVNKHEDPQQAMKEIDFADLAMVRASINAAGPTAKHKHLLENMPSRRYDSVEVTPHWRDRINRTPGPTEILGQSANETVAEAPDVLVVEEGLPFSSSVSVDAPLVAPSASATPAVPRYPSRLFTKRLASDVILVDRTGSGKMLGEEDELIVYVAASTSFTTGVSSPMQEGEEDVYCAPNGMAPSQAQTETLRRHGQLFSLALDFSSPGTAKQPRMRPVFTPAELSKTPLKARTKEARIHRLRQLHKGRSAFGSVGAMLSEAQLREEDQRERRHPKGDDDSTVDEVSSGLGGMDLDPDVELGMDAMKGFLTSMGVEASRFVTMDDIEDEARMRREDEEDQGGPTGSSKSEPSDEDGDEDEDRDEHEENEEEEAFNVEEELSIAESEEELNRTIDAESRVEFPSSSPQDSGEGRVKLSKVAQQTSDADHSDHAPDDGFALWKGGADGDGLPAQINDILEEHSDIVTRHNRKHRKQLFRNLHQGYVDEYNLEEPMDTQSVSLSKARKAMAMPDTLSTNYKARWERNRAKNAEYKRQRHEARLQAAVDPFSNHKGGKKVRKAMLAASKLNPEDLVSMIPNAIVDIASLEA